MRIPFSAAAVLVLMLNTGAASAQDAVSVTTDEDAEGSVAAVSLFGNATGTIALSGTGDTYGSLAASGTGRSVGLFGSASGTGYSYSWLAAVSGTGDAGIGVVSVAPGGDAEGLVAVSILGDADGVVGATALGDANGLVAATGGGDANGFAAYTILGDAHGTEMSGSVLGDSYTERYACYDPLWRVCTGRAVSVTGNASGPTMPISVFGDARRGGGQGLGTCNGRTCYAIGVTDQSGQYATVSVLGDASAQSGPAVSVMGDASNCDPDRPSYSCGHPAVSVFGDARNEGPAVSVFGDANGNFLTLSACRMVERETGAAACIGRPALLP